MSPEDISVVENPAQSRFEAQLDGYLAVADYRLEGDSMIFTHTEVPPAFRGRGIAEKLVLAGFRDRPGKKTKNRAALQLRGGDVPAPPRVRGSIEKPGGIAGLFLLS